MKHLRLLTLFAAGLALCLGGCKKSSSTGGGDEGEAPLRTKSAAKTPKAVLADAREAILDNNRKLYVDCWSATPQQAKPVGAMFDMIQTQLKLEHAAVKAYGKPKVLEAFGQKLFAMDAVVAEDWARKLKFDQQGDAATVTDGPEALKDSKLVKKKGLWKLDAAASPELNGELVQVASRLSKAVDQVLPRIGKRGYTIDKLKADLQAAQEGGGADHGGGTVTPDHGGSVPIPDHHDGGDHSHADAGAATPKAALAAMRQALKDLDKNAFVACWSLTAEQVQRAEAFFQIAQDQQRVERAAVAAYGKQKVHEAFPADFFSFDLMLADDWDQSMRIEEQGNTATVADGNFRGTKLVKRNGAWKLDGEALPADILGVAPRMTKAVEKALPKIGTEGYTAEKLRDDLKAAANEGGGAAG